MTRLATTLSALVILFAAAPSSAGMNEAQVRKLWAKVAKALGEKPKLVCVCLADDPDEYKMGFVYRWQNDPSKAGCFLPEFLDGEIDSHGLCNGPFEVLRK